MKKVLIIEDDLMIADMIAEVLSGDGFRVCGVARTVAEALVLADLHRPQLALVDVRLADGDLGTNVAPILIAKYNTGILYATGNANVLLNARGQASLRKPFAPDDLKSALRIVSEIVETGKASPPFPLNIRLLGPWIGGGVKHLLNAEHAKIGERAVETDLLDDGLSKASPAERKTMFNRSH
jgi:DNA-binding response OmpR family regulator